MSALLATLAMCGDSGCGKTSLLEAANSGGDKIDSKADLQPTIEDSFHKLLHVGNHALMMEILDSSGLAEYGPFRAQLYEGVKAFILCFSICDRISFESISTWVEEIRSISSTSSFILVGCKSDVRLCEREENLVTIWEAISLTRKLKAVRYLECSAWTGEGVQSVIEWAAEMTLQVSSTAVAVSKKDLIRQTLPAIRKDVEVHETQCSLIRRINLIIKREKNVTKPALQEWGYIEIPRETTHEAEKETLLELASITMHLSEDLGRWRDSLLALLKRSIGEYSLPECSPFWYKIRRSLVICPVRADFRIHCCMQLLCHMRSLGIVYSSLFPRSPEEILEEIIINNSSPDLLLSLSRYMKTRDLLKSIITTFRTTTSIEFGLGEKGIAKPFFLLNVLDQTERHDWLDLESTLKILLKHQPVNKLAKTVHTEFSLSDRTGLIDLLHEILRLENGLQDRCRIDRFLSKIVKETGQLPTSMIVDNVKRKGSNPFSGGGFADVWRGMQGDVEVVMKVLRIYGEREHEKQILWAFCAEALVWHRLHHRNVMPFHGVCIWEFAPQRALISPWMKNGHILNYLRAHSSDDRCAMMLGVACGMEYLHTLNPAVVHGDLRASNVLIDDEGQPRISDFGLATFIDSQASTLDQSSFKGKGSMRWQAPELLDSARFNGITLGLTTKSDVYAFACVCLEIFTEQVPFSNLRDGEVILEVAVRDGRPPRPPQPAETRGLSDEVWALVQNCWAVQPGERPSMTTVLTRIQGITGSHHPETISALVKALELD